MTPISRLLAAGDGWSVSDVVCTAGPRDRPVEEQHAGICIAAVTAGSFQYRSAAGSSLLAPGALLLGNDGACFECGHEHAAGDRCTAFHFTPRYFDAVLSALPGARHARFTRVCLPPMDTFAPLLAAAEAAREAKDADAFAEIAPRLAAGVARCLAGTDRRGQALGPRDTRRITASVRRIEAAGDEPLPLDLLAREAAMSPYHFLRVFREVVGMTPHQFVLRTRMHRAATRLRRSRDNITTIALDAGFNDISTFNRRFRQVMGMSPRDWRGRAVTV